MTSHIVVVGSLNMDLVVRVQRHPQLGETVLGGEFRTFPGGKGANQAVAAARLGATVKMIGRVGPGGFGDSLLDTLRRDNVDTAHIRRDGKLRSGVALITVDANGQNTIVVASGANGELTPDDVTAGEAAFAGAAVLLLQLECPLAAVERAIELAKKHGAQVILNPAPAQMLNATLLESVDYLAPNQTELALLTGVDDLADTRRAADHLRAHGVKRVIVTLGEEGVLAVDDEGEFYLPAHPVTVVDTTAAGDAFVGALAVALMEGRSMREAVVWGNAAGGLTVTRPGAQPSLPARAELEEFLRSAKQ